ncbi:hypothetical protein GQR58_008550 [Nymphon striatum]|nr:hypothetical protein GQR58_008550 [Nymphon striatum]
MNNHAEFGEDSLMNIPCIISINSALAGTLDVAVSKKKRCYYVYSTLSLRVFYVAATHSSRRHHVYSTYSPLSPTCILRCRLPRSSTLPSHVYSTYSYVSLRVFLRCRHYVYSTLPLRVFYVAATCILRCHYVYFALSLGVFHIVATCILRCRYVYSMLSLRCHSKHFQTYFWVSIEVSALQLFSFCHGTHETGEPGSPYSSRFFNFMQPPPPPPPPSPPLTMQIACCPNNGSTLDKDVKS